MSLETRTEERYVPLIVVVCPAATVKRRGNKMKGHQNVEGRAVTSKMKAVEMVECVETQKDRKGLENALVGSIEEAQCVDSQMMALHRTVYLRRKQNRLELELMMREMAARGRRRSVLEFDPVRSAALGLVLRSRQKNLEATDCSLYLNACVRHVGTKVVTAQDDMRLMGCSKQ